MALAQPTQVRIYNRALALLGSVTRVANIDDGQAATTTLNALWDTAVREALAEHPWNFALKRANLNKSAAADDDGGILCQLPPDCLRWLPWARDDTHYFCGVQEGNFLLVDGATPPRIRYIAATDFSIDPANWPPHFVTLMGFRLAWEAAEPITQSASIAKDMMEKYHGIDGAGGALADAKRADGLATGDRDRGNVSVQSRALRAAGTPYGPRAPGR